MQQPEPIAQPWIRGAAADSIFILSPPFLALLVVMLFPAAFKNSGLMPVPYWVVLIVMIDVAHVYSTLYRTYFNSADFKKQQHLLLAVPLFCYIAGVILYTFGGMVFWRVLAYLAVFHFVRQQYGFMRIYSRKEQSGKLYTYIDNATIYIATIYPLLYWHFTAYKKNFNWFIDGDFVALRSDTMLLAGKTLYLVSLVAYIIKELWLLAQGQKLNLPKNLIVAGTFLSWYFGIIYFNGDMAFTTLNVVSHGIPYMALIWMFERNKLDAGKQKVSKLIKLTFSRYGVLLFVGVLILFSYTEEGLWDGLVWKEHAAVFKPFAMLPSVSSDLLLALLVPLLALPQSTHYVLDGFIWKVKKTTPEKAH